MVPLSLPISKIAEALVGYPDAFASAPKFLEDAPSAPIKEAHGSQPSTNRTPTMVAIGSLMFCDDCGSLLEASSANKTTLSCDLCGATCQDTSAKVIVTKSKPSDFPSELRSRRSQVQNVDDQDMQTYATIRETCDKCGTEEVQYYSQQLRSADEGSTIFYTCPKCGNKWNTNN